jgi:hypothetical protein
LKYGVEVYKIDTDDHQDVGDMTKEEFSELKRNADFINLDNYLLRSINRLL